MEMNSSMSVCFITNYLTHHQLPFCLEMQKRLGSKFKFIETDALPEERKKLGYQLLGEQFDFVVNACESPEKYGHALQIVNQSEVVMIGSAPDLFIRKRMKENKLTFRCAERIFKHGRFDLLRWAKHTFKNLPYRNKNMYYLLNSAYAAKDFVLCGAKREKMYTWGYFPECIQYTDETLSEKKAASILWVGRLIRLKHPDASIYVAERLKKEGYDFHLTIVGTGEMENELKKTVSQKCLENNITFVGAVPSDTVRSYMEKNEIFIFTSDKNEGWGAVVNEAMNSGCAIVACNEAGAVPCMIANGQNGLTYEPFDDYDALYLQIKKLIDEPALRKRLGKMAYETIRREWNAKNATERLLRLTEVIRNGGYTPFSDGIASSAKYM